MFVTSVAIIDKLGGIAEMHQPGNHWWTLDVSGFMMVWETPVTRIFVCNDMTVVVTREPE